MSGVKGKSGRKPGFKNPNAGRPEKLKENKKVTLSIRRIENILTRNRIINSPKEEETSETDPLIL